MSDEKTSMICARCSQPIAPGHHYHERRTRTDLEEAAAGMDPITTVHDYPCPTRIEVVDSRVLMNGQDIGPIEQYDTGNIAWPVNIPTILGGK